MDIKQEIFENYEVPDPARINKAVRFIENYFKKIEGLNVLDCGFSKGGVADILSRRGANCFGVDINPREFNGIKTIQADLNNGIPNIGVEFDVIFAGEIIEHIFDDGRFARECRKVLKPGGILIITTPNLVNFFNRFLMFFGAMPSNAHAADSFHYHVYNRSTFKNLIKKEGFTILKATSSYLPIDLSFVLARSSLTLKVGRLFEFLGDVFPTLGTQLMIFAKK